MRIVQFLCLWLLLGLSLWLGLSQDGVRSHGFHLSVEDPHHHQQLVGRAYRPATGTAPYPAVILCHGVSSSKDTMMPLAIALAQRGIAAVVFDFGGFGESYRRPQSPEANLRDTQRVVDWVRQQLQFDANRLGIGGHSMGGTTALDVALQDEALRTTFLLGIAGVATPTSPQNLFLGSGIYEELNPVSVMEEFWALAIAPDAVSADDSDTPYPFRTYSFQTHSFQTVRQVGHPAADSARRLVFSPTADHFLAPYDQTLIREVTDWVAQSLGPLDSVSDRSVLRHSSHLGWRLLGQVSTGGSLLGLLTYGYSRIYRYARSRGWLLGGMVTMAAIAVLLLTDSVPWSNGGLLALVMILGVGNYCCRDDFHRHCSFAAKVRLSMLYLGLIYLVFMVAVGVHALIAGSLLAYPQAIAYFPHLVLTLPVPLIYDRVQWLRYSLNSSVGIGIAGSIMAIEMMRPGWVLFGVGKGFKKGLTFSRQPWTWQLTSTSTAQSRQTLILAGLLLLVLAIALGYQYQAGILTWEATQVVLKLALGFIVLPTVLLIGIVRSPLFRAIETAVKQSYGSHGSQSRPHGF